MSREGKLAVFNLPGDIREREVEDIFVKFGSLSRVNVRQLRGGSVVAFVEYDDDRDAEDAIKDCHGLDYDGRRLRVEHSRPPAPRRRDSRSRGRRDSRKRRDSRRRRSPPRRKPAQRKINHGDYWKVRVEGMPPQASWQDMKDFLRASGSVRFADLEGERGTGIGVGGFSTQEEQEKAIKDLDDTKFTARDNETAFVKVTAAGSPEGQSKRDRSRSRSNRKRSDSRAKSEKSRSRSRSGSRK